MSDITLASLSDVPASGQAPTASDSAAAANPFINFAISDDQAPIALINLPNPLSHSHAN